ncbi:MAG: hypothetical protein HC853_14375 [Anaerolineae bacterium]|nr:hypothetical protein [Anaerolineae bacterium]
MQHEFGQSHQVLSETDLLLAAKSLGLKAKISEQDIARLKMAALPALVIRDDGKHFILAKVVEDKVLIHDLEEGRPKSFSVEEFQTLYQGRLFVVASRASVLGQLAKFDFTWFIPAVVKYRKLLLEVLALVSGIATALYVGSCSVRRLGRSYLLGLWATASVTLLIGLACSAVIPT